MSELHRIGTGTGELVESYRTTYNTAAAALRDAVVTADCTLTPEFWTAAQNWPWAPVRSTLPALRPSRFPRRPIERR